MGRDTQAIKLRLREESIIEPPRFSAKYALGSFSPAEKLDSQSHTRIANKIALSSVLLQT
jgi:hypothetical protein